MIGQTIVHYKVTAKLGQGGMGAVYRATDTKLDREVAIKILPTELSQSAERLARFEREAKVLATLSHPNIAGIFGLEQSSEGNALVLELVEGEDLSQRLKRGPLPVEDALDVCKQIADALEIAHEKGVIHRDLKPGNVKLTEDGMVKVLDFGLAKAETGTGSSTAGAGSMSPTITADFTLPGTLLGTAGYMSPEQARGNPVDKRSDIWSFGCVLWECLTGERLFAGETTSDLIGALLHQEIDWSQLPPTTPPTIQLLLRKCLTRDRKRRLRDIGDAVVDLEEAIAGSSTSFIRLGEGALREPRTGPGIPPQWVAGLVLGVAVVTVAFVWFLKPAPPVASPLPPKRSQILIDSSRGFFTAWGNNAFALSGDGKSLVYNLQDNGARGLWLRDLETGETNAIPETDGGVEGHPFLSPDGNELGCMIGDALLTMPTSGGQARTLADKSSGLILPELLGADWRRDGKIVFGSAGQPLKLLSKTGDGRAEELTELEENQVHAFPQFLPDGKHVLFVSSAYSNGITGRAHIVNVSTRKLKELDVVDCTFARYSPSGHLLYSRGNDVYAQAFDLATLSVSGPERQVLKDVELSGNEMRSQFEVSDDGTLVYLPKGPDRTLVWIDTEGSEEPATTMRGNWKWFDLSPNEERLAIREGDKILVLNKRGDVFDESRTLVAHDSIGSNPLWSPDSQSVYYYSNREGKHGVWKQEADLVGDAALVWESKLGRVDPMSVSANYLMMAVRVESAAHDIWRLHLDGDSPWAEEWIATEFPESVSLISPDEKWLAYGADVGDNWQVYARPMDDSMGPMMLSKTSGFGHRWLQTSDPYEVVYKSEDKIYRVSFTAQGDRLERGEPEEILTVPVNSYGHQFSVSRDGKRFLILVNVPDDDSNGEATAKPIHLEMVSNWFTELNGLVPPGGGK